MVLENLLDQELEQPVTLDSLMLRLEALLREKKLLLGKPDATPKREALLKRTKAQIETLEAALAPVKTPQ